MVLPKSDVWQYFTRVSKTEAKCKVCFKLMKSSGNTSNLKGHLKTHQLKDECEPPVQKIPRKTSSTSSPIAISSTSTSCTAVTRLDEDVDSPLPLPEPGPSGTSSVSSRVGLGLISSESASGSGSSHVNQLSQPQIHRKFAEMKTFSEGGTRHCAITQAVLYFISKDYMPLSVVDGAGFRYLMKQIVPLYKMPTRNTIKSLIESKYLSVSHNFKSVLQDTAQFSITTDCWSDMMSTKSYLGITAHFIDGTTLESVGLGVVPLEESHTADYLGSKILSTLNEWNITQLKIASIVTDNEATMVKAVVDTFGKNKHIRCLAHTVNLLAESSIKNTDGLLELLKKVRDIVKYVKKSVVASDMLRKEQANRGVLEGEVLKLVLDVPTRWNSSYFMIERFLILLKVVSNILLTKPEAPPMLTSIDIENLREVKNMLAFLEQLTRELSGEKYVTASMAIPLLNCLFESITKSTPKLMIGMSLKASLLKQFQKRFGEIEQAHLLALAMFLDPRFKNIHFSDPKAASRTLNHIKNLVAGVSDDTSSPKTDSEEESPQLDIWSHHKTLALKSNKKMVKSSFELDTEVSMYLATPVSTNHKAKPLELWEDMKAVYPKLYVLARQYLVSVSTSVPSERLFSKAGAIVTERRNRLSGNLLNKLLFLNCLPEKYWH